MLFKKEKEKKKPTIVIDNIIKPIKVKDNERIILVAGDEHDSPSEEVFRELSKEVRKIKDGESVVIPGVIKLYIVPRKTKIELYHGAKYESS